MPKDQGLMSWKELVPGMYIIEPGNSKRFRTGDWRAFRPVVDKEKCVKCGTCYILCPDLCFQEDEDGYFKWNEFYCKGCGICATHCPKKAISMVLEEE